MNIKLLLSAACVLAAPLAQAEGAHWGYSGHGGPKEWAALDEGFKTCKLGKLQSPINIETRKVEKAERAADKSGSGAADVRKADAGVHSSAELLEQFQGKVADAPICLTCGTKMRPAGSCYVCEGCGSTSGCS